MNNNTIYYFTGTGNSLFIAKKLSERLPDSKLIPIISLIDKDEIVPESDVIGFVYPLHGLSAPIPVKKFIKKLKLKGSEYIYAVVNRGGTKNLSFDQINKILAGKNNKLNSGFIINMPNNDPKFSTYYIPDKNGFKEYENNVINKLEMIKDIVLEHKDHTDEDKNYIDFPLPFPFNYLLEKLVLWGMNSVEQHGANDYFYADEKCTGCGTCVKVCPSGKIKLENGKPLWQNNIKCLFEYACINYCPAEAIQIKPKWYMNSYTTKNGRYPHPYASSADIENQKKGG